MLAAGRRPDRGRPGGRAGGRPGRLRRRRPARDALQRPHLRLRADHRAERPATGSGPTARARCSPSCATTPARTTSCSPRAAATPGGICYGGRHDDVPGCFGNLAAALAPYGIAPDAIPTSFNVFMRVALGAGRPAGGAAAPLARRRPPSPCGPSERLIVGLTACSAKASNNGRYKPIGYAIELRLAPERAALRVDAPRGTWYASEVPADPPWFGRFRVRSGELSADDFPAGP